MAYAYRIARRCRDETTEQLKDLVERGRYADKMIRDQGGPACDYYDDGL